MIREFYAVTSTSLYRVVDSDPEDRGRPTATKISCRSDSRIPVGGKIGGGELLSIGKQLIPFIPEGGGTTSYERRIELVNVRYWVMNSSFIVGLFLDEKVAQGCFASKGLERADPRWRKETEEVLASIPDDHPTLVVCRDQHLGLVFAKA